MAGFFAACIAIYLTGTGIARRLFARDDRAAGPAERIAAASVIGIALWLAVLWCLALTHQLNRRNLLAALRRLARGNFIVAPSVVFRAEAVRAIGAFSPLDFVVDWEYWLRGVLAGFTIAGTHRRLVRFRRHAATATRALERTQDRYREEIALQRWIEREAKLPAQYATVSRIILSEIAATLASGDRARAAELLSFARTEVPGFSGTATSALANLAIASGKLGGRAMLAAQAVALRLAV